MIRLEKPEAPAILQSQGAELKAALCAAYDAEPDIYRSGSRPFTFYDSIYAHPDVKSALCEAQGDKCCFCESRIGLEGDVEHFRPKAAMCQGKRKPMLRPGYYWLAYDWDNLLLCCGICNQRFKRNYFPLEEDAARARSHHADISSEKPLFLNPARTDPEVHIAFRGEHAYHLTPEGKMTIDSLQLNRKNLWERRRDRLEAIAALAKFAQADVNELPAHLQDKHEQARIVVAKASSTNAEFTSMIRHAARNGFEPVS